MALKVIIPPGLTEVTVNGLHQWDYGREIEIHADNLPALVEVHSACAGMETAVVRNCAVVDGTITAAVPDICLEQTAPIVAWVYAIGATSGKTLLTIKLPITPRTKPQPGATLPEAISDKYTEAVAAMEALVDGIETRVATTLYQDGWTAKRADEAGSAQYDAAGRPLSDFLASPADGYTELQRGAGLFESGIVLFRIINVSGGNTCYETAHIITEISGSNKCFSPIFVMHHGEGIWPRCLSFTPQEDGRFKIGLVNYRNLDDSPSWEYSEAGENVGVSTYFGVVRVYYKYLVKYPTA